MLGAFISNIGSWMQRVAQDWLVLTVLTDHSATAVGITTGLQFAPTLICGPLAGSLADRLPKRKLLVATQVAMGLTALLLGALVLTDTVQLWHAYALALLLGVASAIEGPVRQVFVNELVSPEDLPNAVGLNSASFNGARIFGPGLAGLLIHAVGTGPVFMFNAATFGTVLLALALIRGAELNPENRTKVVPGQFREAIAHIRERPDLVITLIIVGMVGTFGLNFSLTTAVMATSTFDRGPGSYGLLGSVMAIGALTGSLLAARRGEPRLRFVVGAAGAFGGLASIAALMPTYWLFAAALIPVGVATQTLLNTANSRMQLGVAPALRGRVSAVYLAILMGGTPFGSPLIGWIGETFGPRWTILVGGLISLGSALLAAGFLLRRQGPTVQR
jgi:MFS family permease